MSDLRTAQVGDLESGGQIIITKGELGGYSARIGSIISGNYANGVYFSTSDEVSDWVKATLEHSETKMHKTI